MSADMAVVFISHASEDATAAGRVAEFLHATLKFRPDEVFCSSDADPAIAAGVEFEREILTALRSSSVVIFLISPFSLSSLFCVMELGAAWGLKKRIVPVLLSNAESAPIERPLASLQLMAWNNPATWGHLLQTIKDVVHVQRRNPDAWANAQAALASTAY